MKYQRSLVLALLLSSAFSLSAQQVTLNSKNQKLGSVLTSISRQTGMTLAYSSQFVDLDKRVSISAKGQDLAVVLNRLLGNTDIAYDLKGRKILLYQKRKDNAPAVSAPRGTTGGNSGNPSPVRKRHNKITGVVTDEKGEPIVGAGVTIAGSKQGVLTDVNGKFSINADAGSRLEVSYIGFSRAIVPVNGQDEVTVRMKEDLKNLKELVVIGYGTTTVKNSTGSISSIKAGDIETYPSSNFASALSGKMTGVQVSLPSGTPGSSPVIRVRGIGTLTAGSNPLIVVDGFPLTEGSDINSVDMNSIQSIEVLKDAASTAIYGSRGANGIIMITTKSGMTGKPQVSLSASFGVQQRYDRMKFVDAYEMAQYMYEARNTGYVNKDPEHRKATDDTATRIANGASKRELIPDYLWPYLKGEKGLTNTDWMDEIFRIAPMQNYDIAVRGGSEKSSYSFSMGYLKQEGIEIGSGFEKLSANINLKFKPASFIDLGASLSPSYSHSRVAESQKSNNFLLMANAMYPFFSPYNKDGSLAISEQIKANTATDGALMEDPVAYAELSYNGTNTPRIFGNVYADITFFKDLKYKLNLGGDYESSVYKFFKPSDLGEYRAAAPQPASAQQTNTSRTNYLIENTLTYTKQLNAHFIQMLLGQSYQKEDQEALDVVASGFSDNSIQNIAGGSTYKVTPDSYSWAMISYFGRLNYNYKGTYLFSGSLRRDGSSRFGANTKWGLFPAVSGAWIMSNEKFLQDSRAVQYLKLRASWGKSGNNQIPNYGSLALLQTSNYVFGGKLAPGTSISTSPNADLSWEMTSTLNFGVDLTLFDYLGLSADYYIANTNDLLLNVPVPEQSGYVTSLQNIGKIRNNGFEIRLSTAKDVKFGDVVWNSSFNLSTNKNKVLALANGQTQIIGDKGFSITRVGHSISEYYGYDVIGVYKNQDDFNKYPSMKGTQIGDYIIKDLNNDGVIDTKDKKSFGSPTPKVVLGFNNTFRYKQFELMVDMYSELGKKIYSQALSNMVNPGEGFAVPSKDYFENRYHPENNPDGIYATPNMGNFSNDRKESRISNMFFYNASNFSIRTLKFAYNLPSSFLNKVGIKTAQLYFLANNLLIVTPYKGLNPNGDTSDALNQGYDNFNYPVPRTFTFGLNVNF